MSLRALPASLSIAGLFSFVALYAACGGGGTVSFTTSNNGGSGGAGSTTSSAATTTSAQGGSGGETATTSTTSSTTTTSSSTTTTTSSTTTTTTSSSTTTTGWPTCDAPEPGAVQKTLHQIWLDDPAQPTEVWVPGVFVTGVAKGGCTAGVACQIFVQSAEQFADLAAGSQQALKMFISANTAQHFTGVKVGDKVDVDAFAWRYTVNGQNELLLQVNLQYKGCAKVVGAGNPLPVSAKLDQLTLSAYEDTVGPLLVKVDMVAGTPQLPAETFGLFTPGMFSDAGPEAIVSLSPYLLPTGAFTGLTQGMKTTFPSVTGVFGLFSPTASPSSKYKEIYPRNDNEY